jgi:hypothetical protein
MTNDDLDTDIDIQEEQGAEPPAKPSLKDVWEGSPALKIAAVVLGAAILVGAYVIFFSGSGDETKSLVNLSGSAQTKQIPGQQELDPAYRKALVEANVQTAKEAVQTGGSALPTPISTTKTGGLDMPGLPDKSKADPLAEWRGKAQASVKGVGTSCPRSKADRLQNEQSPGHVHCPGEEAEGATGDGGGISGSGADALLEEARRRAAANGTTIEEELAKMAAEKGGSDALLEEARRRAAANGTTVEEELRRMAAEKAAAAALLEEAKSCVKANPGMTVEQCLERIRAQKAMLDEAKRRAAANGTTLEEELAKMAAEKAAAAALLEEAKRCAAANPGMTVEKCLEKIKAEKALLDAAKRCAAAGGGTVEQCLAKMAETDPLAKALLDEAKRRAAAAGTTVEAELARMAAEKDAAAAALEEARRRAAANGTTLEEELARMAAEKAATEALLEKARRCAKDNPGMTVEQCLKKIEAEQAALEEAKRRAAANGTTLEEELAKMAAEKALLEAAKRCAAENPGMTVEKCMEKIKAEKALLEEAKRRAALNGTTLEEELRKMAAEAAAAGEEAKRKLADEAIRNLAGGGEALPEVAAAMPPTGAGAGAGTGPQATGRVMQTPEEAKEAAKALLEQMRVIIAAQTPPKPDKAVISPETSPYKKLKAVLEAKEAAAAAAAAKDDSAPGGASSGAAGGGTAGAPAAGEAEKQTIVPAGSIVYAQLLTELNSDIMGPALVQILSGPFAGGRAIGKVKVKEAYNEYMVLTFSTLVKDGVSYKMNGIAMDENTTLTGQATDIDHHYLDRIIMPAAAKFVEGYGGALAKTGSTVAPPTGAGAEPVTVAEPKPSPKEGLFKGLEESTKVVTEIIGKSAERPVTVKIAKGTTMGIFFIDPVTTGDAGK